MSFELRDYLRHILEEADIVWDVVQTRIPDLRTVVISLLES
jgi:uncharacterized protein with HEPN domain